MAQKSAKYADDKKALDIVILDMRGLVNFCDYFVLATGTSDRHVKSVAQGVEDELEGEGVKVNHGKTFKGFGGAAQQGGQDLGAWVLLDMGDVVVHVFEPQAREFYGLEHLWQDAPKLEYKRRSRKS